MTPKGRVLARASVAMLVRRVRRELDRTFLRQAVPISVAACGIAAILVTTNGRAASAQTPTVGATALIRDATDRLVATAAFREGRGEVLISISFDNPPPLSGMHALHINELGKCDPPDFTSSGNIFNPFNKQHGRQNPDGAEVGDLPNIDFGNGQSIFNTTAIGATLAQGPGSLLTPNRAIVIFAGEDDQKTGPEGNAGARIACGVITALQPTATLAPAQVAAGQPAITPPPAGASPAVAVPKVASPVSGQTVQSAQPAQAVQSGQSGQAGQPAASPIPAISPVANAAASKPSPGVGAPVGAAATPIVIQPTSQPPVAAAPPSAQAGASLSSSTALIIAVLGVGLMAAGYLLRRRGQIG